MRRTAFAAVVALAWVCTAASAHAQVAVRAADGRVSIDAVNATVAEILTRWAQVQKITIVNGDKLPAGRVTLRFEAVPESEALATLLRDAGGYIVGRRSGANGATEIDRILVVGRSTAIARVSPATAPAPPPQIMAEQPAMDTDVPEPVIVGAGARSASHQGTGVAAAASQRSEPATSTPPSTSSVVTPLPVIPGLTPQQVAALPPMREGMVRTASDVPPEQRDQSTYERMRADREAAARAAAAGNPTAPAPNPSSPFAPIGTPQPGAPAPTPRP